MERTCLLTPPASGETTTALDMSTFCLIQASVVGSAYKLSTWLGRQSSLACASSHTDRDIEETLNLRSVKIHRDDMIDALSCHGQL
jgi:hypothetical protein